MGRFRANDKQNLTPKDLIDRINSNATELNENNNEIVSNIDWTQLLSPYQSQNLQTTLQTIITKVNTCENIQFDQICLVLQHYLLNSEFYELFLKENCINVVLDRFYRNPIWNTNAEWMISEVFKLITSLCKQEQVNYLLTEKFQVLFQNLFNLNVDSLSQFNQIQTSVFKNLIDTAINVCEIKHDLCALIPITWLHEFILKTAEKTELCGSLANLLFTISSRKADYLSAFLHLYPNTLTQFQSLSVIGPNSNNLSFILLIGSLINTLLAQTPVNYENILRVLHDYGHVLANSLQKRIDDNEFNKNEEIGEDEEEKDSKEDKELMKFVEALVESKLITLELLQSIFSAFLKENEEEGEWEDDNEAECLVSEEMEVEAENENESEELTPSEKHQEFQIDPTALNRIIKDQNIITVLIETIVLDDESLFQKNEKIEYLDKSVKLVKTEACLTYMMSMKFDQNTNEQDLKKEHLLGILKKISDYKADSDVANEDHLNKMSVLCSEIAKITAKSIGFQLKVEIVQLMRIYFEKNSIKNEAVTINLCRMLAQLLIDERNAAIVPNESKELIKNASTALMNLIEYCILNVETKNIYLFAELLDCLIDVYSEDNLKDVEAELRLVDRMKEYNRKFQSMIKGSNYKLSKDKKVIVKTVSDNLDPFIDYKLKH